MNGAIGPASDIEAIRYGVRGELFVDRGAGLVVAGEIDWYVWAMEIREVVVGNELWVRLVGASGDECGSWVMGG
ncbi:hypothetical protein Tco_0502834 [Tanacetum coccineum]